MLSELNIKAFLNQTASASPVPGGGSMAALAGAIAAALSEMVANLTTGKKGYESSDEEMKRIATAASVFRERLTKNIDRDADAYHEVMTAFKLPKRTGEEKAVRNQAIQDGLKRAASVPLDVAKDAFEIMELARKVVENGNKNAVTDGAVAVMMARTAVLSALYNVKINLKSINDTEFADKIGAQVKRMETEIDKREKEILSGIGL